ncbi:hypothetical protein PSU4_27040 [Pseudonocardia sulfidoxydans NBRC 16205]|uniref:Amidohydrolase-related domain-containing protein n=1 Tax=Pseudonocardia sulfidoxydans NBRC 16205 TaxID=1223511 RepID=A0A511DG42_9PSEU|nr:amidohydrolase family protein [Pseudonocardia sulfidoxydans]GEL23750.1 hypothetical protein PSU4_27040 [Pseudonocardia sulfidoxydans NBRC 16205]
MSTTGAIDLTCLPFTPDTKEGAYQHPGQKSVLQRLGIWDKPSTADDLVQAMDAAGVDKLIVPAQAGNEWDIPWEIPAEMALRHPGRLYAVQSVNPSNISQGLRNLDEASKAPGFVGAHSYPHWWRLAPDDRVYYPFYAKCQELGVPIQIQVGQAFQNNLYNVGHPSTIDRIAVDFPELPIIGLHVGYPWEREMVAVSWKHPNVYIALDTHHPSSWSRDVTDFIRGDGATKMMFATNYPILDFADAISGIADLKFGDETEQLILRGNAERVYRF